MQPNNPKDRILPLEGAYNLRDLGGLTFQGGATQPGRLFRADGLSRLTDKDREVIQSLGIKLVIDLRSEQESTRLPDRIEGTGARHLQIPLLDNVQSGVFKAEDLPGSLTGMYRRMLDRNQPAFFRIFEAIAGEDAPILFHCTAGKDRTGVTAALLLSAAGVPEDAIVADYALTEQFVAALAKVSVKRYQKMGITLPAYLFESKPETMRQTLVYLEQQYGGAIGYFKTIGLGDAAVSRLCRRLLLG